MATYSKKEASIQFHILFFAFLGITSFFVIPQFKDYLIGKESIEINVQKRKETKLDLKDTVLYSSNINNAKLISRADFVIKIVPNTGWGYFFVLQELLAFILLFIGLWYLLKFTKAMQSEDRFENRTQHYMLRLGQLLVLGGMLSYANKYFMNFYVLDKLGFSGYKISDVYGEYILIGVALIFLSKYYKKGLELQQENDLTV